MSNFTWQSYNTSLHKLKQGDFPEHLDPPQPHSIITDTRVSLKGLWFLPLKGQNFDGHNFIHQALKEKGAIGAFCSNEKLKNVPKELHCKLIIVKDTLLTLQKIATMNRLRNTGVKVLAMTGSVGKTTCRRMLESIVEQTNKSFLRSEKNFNNEIGVPLTLLKLKPEHKYAVLELGARHPGDIGRLVDICLPNYVACLNIGHSHLEIFGSRENIFQTKSQIFNHTDEYKAGVVLGDDPKLTKLAKSKDQYCYTFGLQKNNDCFIKEIISKNGTCKIHSNLFGTPVSFSLQNFHEAYPINALAAASLAKISGIHLDTIASGLMAFRSSDSRFKTYLHKNKIIIDDSYNASPESMRSGIKTVNKLYPDKKISYILGDMLEFGEESQAFHQELGKFCALNQNIDNLLVVGEYSKETAKSATRHGLKSSLVKHFANVEELINAQFNLSNFGEVIYIKGSLGIKLFNYFQYLLKK